jgi:hypothetical protein
MGDTVVAVAGWGLPGERPFPDAPLDDAGWRALLDSVTRHRLTGLLDRAVAAGALPVTTDQRAEVEAQSIGTAATAVSLERLALRAATTLRGCGIEHRLLKGPALAHSHYADPTQRTFGDVDLVVSSSQLAAAADALQAGGLRREGPERRSGFDARFNKSVVLLDEHGLQVDLHRTLAPVPYGPHIDAERIFAGDDVVHIGGEAIPILDLAAMLVHVSLHAALSGRVRLMTLRDVAQLLPLAPVQDTLATAERWAACAPVASSVRLAVATFGLAADGELTRWAEAYRRTRRDDRLFAPFERRGRAVLPTVLATVRELEGAKTKAAYLTAIAFPSSAYLRDRARSRLAFVRHAATASRRPK